MQVNSASSQSKFDAKQAKLLKEKSATQKKLEAKFGDTLKLTPKKLKDADVVIDAAKAKKAQESSLMLSSDIGKNDPKDSVTTDKLRGLIQNGGFNFSDKERRALAEILKV